MGRGSDPSCHWPSSPSWCRPSWAGRTSRSSRAAAIGPRRPIAASRALDRPTERTVETLRRYDLERDYRRDVNEALLRIEKFAQQRAEPELVYALAELSWIEGKRLDRWRKPQALDRYLDAAAYAYDFLFDPDPVLAQGRKPADPRYRQAMEIYNAGVDHLIRAAMTRGEIQPQNGEVISVQVPRRRAEAPVRPRTNRPGSPRDVHKLLLATDFEVSGLNRDYHQYGLGVPLIAVRETRRPEGPARARRAVLPRRDGLPADGLPRPHLAAARPRTSTARSRGSARSC